tara:strand:- start:8418 stop:8705 length:288 start_codon:yes stop_codon:yes gene_type:complete
MNPLEKIESDPRLQTILNGLIEMWHYQSDFLAMVVYHTDDFDMAVETIENFSAHDMGLEEALFTAMPLSDFKSNCLESKYLDKRMCKNLFDEGVI